MTNLVLQTNVQKKISPHVLSQFPEFYRDYGPGFIHFVEEYYRWMEEEGPLFDARRVLDYKDVDAATSEFLIYFKNKYLPEVQLETESNVRLMVKHSLDLYRSRGTPRAIDLLFRLVFGRGASVYYPWRDLFRLSDGQWVRPTYLEVTPRNDLLKFVNRDIVGMTSGATGFVERVVRKRTPSKIIQLLYVSSLDGDFAVGEQVNLSEEADRFPLSECPKIIGSLTELEVTSGGEGFAEGDVVEIDLGKGLGGTARVQNVESRSGVIDFELYRGGYGYAANSVVLVSQKVLTLANVNIGTPNNEGWFSLFEVVAQNTCTISYTSLVGGTFANNDTVYAYHANNQLKGTGLVLNVVTTNSTAGDLGLYVVSGNLDGTKILGSSNTVNATTSVFTNTTAVGNVIGVSDQVTVTVANTTGDFAVGEVLTSGNALAQVILWSPGMANTGTMTLEERVGGFDAGSILTGETSMITGNVQSVILRLGVINSTGSFSTDPRATLRGMVSNTTAYVSRVSAGTGANVSFSSDLLYGEDVPICNDLVSDYVAINVAATAYGFPANPTANIASIISETLDIDVIEFGKVASIAVLNPGEDYDAAPIVRIYERRTAPARLVDYIVGYANSTAAFNQGEVVTQSATGAQGLIRTSNSTHLVMERLSIYSTFVPTINSTTRIVGTDSGASANAISVQAHRILERNDIRGQEIGLNALIDTRLVSAEGSVTTLQVLDSGYGYEDGEEVTVRGGTTDALARVVLRKQGVGTGYYKRKGGFLSDQKKLYDGDYWQDFSYEVRSSVPFDKYREMLLALLHVAGTKPFGALYHAVVADLDRRAIPSTVTVT